jgi:hypothetical protein
MTYIWDRTEFMSTPETNTISIPRNIFIIMCVIFAILFGFFLITSLTPSPQPGEINSTLIRDPKNPVPFDKKLRDFLQQGGYKQITLIRNDAKVRIVEADGSDVEPCAKIVGTEIQKIPGQDCHLEKIDLTHINSVPIFTRRYNPKNPCTGCGDYVCCSK